MPTLHNEHASAELQLPSGNGLKPGFFVSTMNQRTRYSLLHTSIVAASILIFITGCEKDKLGTVDSQGKPPVLTSPVVSPDSINIDGITPIGGLYTVNATLTVAVSDPEGPGNIGLVVADVLRPGATSVFTRFVMRDDGVSPDIAAGDGVFSAGIRFELMRSQAGRYRIRVSAFDNDELMSSILEISLFLTRNNSAPRVSNLSAPDTVNLPTGTVLLIPMSVAAADSDGLADVQEVYFLSIDGLNPTTRFHMLDDGSLGPPTIFGLPSGDLVAGDGTFTVIVPFEDSPTIRGTYRLLFQASDSFRDTSASILHYLTIR